MKNIISLWKRWFKSKIPGRKPAGKYTLELLYPGYGRTFLNFWDWSHGNDVCCEIRGGKLILREVDDNMEVKERKITFNTFLQKVEESINQQEE